MFGVGFKSVVKVAPATASTRSPSLAAIGDRHPAAGTDDRAENRVLRCFTAALAHAQKDIHENPAAAAKIAQPFTGDIDPTIYATAFRTSIPSWPPTPVIDDNTAKAALDVMGSALSGDVLNDAIDTNIAPQRPTAPRCSGSPSSDRCRVRPSSPDWGTSIDSACRRSWRPDLTLRKRESDKPSLADASPSGLAAGAGRDSVRHQPYRCIPQRPCSASRQPQHQAVAAAPKTARPGLLRTARRPLHTFIGGSAVFRRAHSGAAARWCLVLELPDHAVSRKTPLHGIRYASKSPNSPGRLGDAIAHPHPTDCPVLMAREIDESSSEGIG